MVMMFNGDVGVISSDPSFAELHVRILILLFKASPDQNKLDVCMNVSLNNCYFLTLVFYFKVTWGFLATETKDDHYKKKSIF